MRIFTGGISTETNSFSPLPTGLDSFSVETANWGENALSRAVHEICEPRGWEHIAGMQADAPPGAPVVRSAYEILRSRLLDELAAAGPVDLVLFSLHGGMIAQGHDDCEGDLLMRAREVVGPDVVIGALFDPHAQFSEAMIDSGAILCFLKENPHTDFAARAEDLIRLALQTASGEIKPTPSLFDCRMADVFQTNREPMKSFVQRLRAMEGQGGVLDISIVHGFRRGDVPLMGAKVLVYTDNRPAEGAVLAERLGMELFGMRGTACAPHVEMNQAIEQAMSRPGPVVLADLADNPGGGSPGDATYILRALLERGVRNIAAGYFCDPMAVRFAIDAGVGARMTMRIGGKCCPLSGEPLDLDVTVTALLENAVQIGTVSMGPAARLTDGELDIVVLEPRIQTYGPEIFVDLGIDLLSKQVILVKSAQHYAAWGFERYMRSDIVVDAPGVCTADVAKLPYTRAPRDIWPFVEDPFAIQRPA